MKNITVRYKNYSEQIEKFGGDEIVSKRINQIYNEMSDYIIEEKIGDIALVNEVLLTHAVMDYFSDIQRLKDYQEIEHANEYKIKAYETVWLLRRKPIQLKSQLDDDRNAFLNERFNILRIANFLLRDDIYLPINDKNISEGVEFSNFLDTLLYYFKFRQCDPQTIELMLLGFDAGRVVEKISKT